MINFSRNIFFLFPFLLFFFGYGGYSLRLKAKNIGNEVSLDEYNAYQYLLYHMDCWNERIFLDMVEEYVGDYASYLLKSSSFLINDDNETYKISSDLSSSSKLVIQLSDVHELFDTFHMSYTCTLFYKGNLVVDDEKYQPKDYVETKDFSVDESHPLPEYEKDFKKVTIPCILNGSNLEVSLFDKDENKALFEKNTIIFRWVHFNINLSETPYIDLKNGRANEPYEILVDNVKQLQNIIDNAPDDGTLTIIRLDSNQTYNIPETLEISKGQNIEIRGGTGRYISSLSNNRIGYGRAILDGTFCRRTFRVKYGATLKLDRLILRNNNSVAYGVHDKGRGGAILVEAIRRENGVNKFGILKCDNCTFTNNKAIFGGAIFSYHAGIFLENCDFIDNYSTHNGGAVYYWANDVRLLFSDQKVANGSIVQLKVRVTDYLARLVGEGEVDFYLKEGNKETYLGTSDVSNYALEDVYGLSTVPTTGLIKGIVTSPDSEVRYNIVTKNNLPVTITKDGKTYLKNYYDDDFKPITLEAGEQKSICVFKRRVNGVALPTRYNEEEERYYLDSSKPELLKHIVYLKEITGLSYVPAFASLKRAKTDGNNEVGFEIIVNDDLKPVLVTNEDGKEHLKPLYDEEFKRVTLSTDEQVIWVVFKKIIDGKWMNSRYDEENNKYYLNYTDPDTLKYIVYDPEVYSDKATKGWAYFDYQIPENNEKTNLQFLAVYKAGVMYEQEVAMNNVSVIFAEKYMPSFTSIPKGLPGDIITISVKIKDTNGETITAPKGTFTIGDKSYTATVVGNGYTLKYKIDPETTAESLPVVFSIPSSIEYTCPKLEGSIEIDYVGRQIEGLVTGLFINSMDVKKVTSGGVTTYVDQTITDDLITNWINAGVTDLFVRCSNYSDESKRALLLTVLNKVKGKGLRVHAAINTFHDASKSTAIERWGNVNPSSTTRRQFIIKEIDDILNATSVDGICFDFCRFVGQSENTSEQLSWNGNVTSANRKKHVTEALKLFNDEVKKIKSKVYTSVTLMPEVTNEYGQDFEAMGKIVDYVMPMCYKGNYEGISENKDTWISDFLNKTLSKSVSKERILCIIQTYSNDTDLELKSKAGNIEDALRTRDNLNKTIKEVATTGVKGNCLYREGLIKQYPTDYKTARGG